VSLYLSVSCLICLDISVNGRSRRIVVGKLSPVGIMSDSVKCPVGKSAIGKLSPHPKAFFTGAVDGGGKKLVRLSL
jgi:hypothetical protein